MRKATLIVTLLLISLFAFAGVASAESYQFEHGNGTAEDPYLVGTAEDLNGVRDYLTAHYKQTANIDLSVYENWEPIGTDTPFAGIYNGNGFIISNLTINRPDMDTVGLFGNVKDGIILRANLANVNIVGHSAGALAGKFERSAVELCKVSGGTISGSRHIGGLASYCHTVYIRGCETSCDLQGCTEAGYCMGGLISCIYGKGVITDCFSRANLNGAGYGNAGGIAAYKDTSTSVINNSYFAGSITNTEAMEGIVAFNRGTSERVTSCYYDSETFGYAKTGDGEPKTTLKMKQQATYVGWDFDNIWDIDPNKNDGYPYLQDNALKSITILPENATKYPGQFIEYYLELKYENGHTKSIVADNNILTINDPDIAILITQNIVRTLKCGSTTITAYCASSTTLTVKEFDGIQIDLREDGDIIDISPSVIYINKGDTAPIIIKVDGYDFTDQINIDSKDTDILMVDDTLKTIAGISPGSTQLNLSHPEVGLLGYVTVNVLDISPISNTPPAITLIGKSLINITKGEEYEDPGATACDEEDGVLTEGIDIDNPVDTSKTGFYTITYTVTDSQGATTTKTRTVVVWKEQIPNITIPNPEDRDLTSDLPGSQNIIIPEPDPKDFASGQAGILNLDIPNTDPRNLTNGQPGGSKINIPEPLNRNLDHGQAGTLNITITGKGSKGLNHGTPGGQNITIPEIQRRELKNGQSGAVNIVIKNK